MSRKTRIAVLAVVFLAPALWGQSIIVNSPAAGNEWCLGSTHTITWTSSGVSGNVMIVLRPADQPMSDPVLTIAASTANDGSHSWSIPGSGLAIGTYEVRVRTVSLDPFIFGDSGNFKIVAAPPPHPPGPSLKVESPNGGESWVRGTDHTISWTSTNLTGKVQVQLYRHPCCFVGVIGENLPATGSFSWKVGDYPGNTATFGEYNIRICSMADHTIFDMSDSPFTIKSVMDHGMSKPMPLLLKPDLVVCANATVYTPLNTPGTFHVYVRNIGKRPAKAPFAVKIILATQETRRVTIETDLAPGETRWVSDYSASNASVVCFHLFVKVDPDDEVAESNEDNNILKGLLHVGSSNPISIPFSCSDGSLLEP